MRNEKRWMIDERGRWLSLSSDMRFFRYEIKHTIKYVIRYTRYAIKNLCGLNAVHSQDPVFSKPLMMSHG